MSNHFSTADETEYSNNIYMNWSPYDPTWLVQLARTQYPNDLWIAESLARCTRTSNSTSAGEVIPGTYLAFIDPAIGGDTDPGFAFWRNIILRQIDGLVIREITLDVLVNREIAGIEVTTVSETAEDRYRG